ncbi:MAG: class I SAM-dependent methyltransferase [Proteobacteria bacterium]|nr:class I SAM-dependent methyltransferase [Pseudomonadota bacterium]
MQSSATSMTGDWDTFWKWELHRRRTDPIDFRQWKADSSRELRALFPGDGVRLLDASCGMGFHALIQHELGFEVEACDANPRVLAAATELFDGAVEAFPARWEELGQLRPDRYDLVFNDEVHQVRPASALLAVLSGFAGCLKPGGALVFFFADSAKPDDGVNQCLYEWEHMERSRHAWTAEGVRLDVEAELVGDDQILEYHRYTLPDGSTETATLSKSYCWDWDSILPVLRDAGFVRFESRRFMNIKGWEYALNLAFVPS